MLPLSPALFKIKIKTKILYSGARPWTWSSKIYNVAGSSEINNHRHAWIMLQFILGKWISRTYSFLRSRHLLPRAVDLTALAVSCVLACKCWKQMLTYSCAIIVAKIDFSGVWQIESIQVVGVECFQSGVFWTCPPPFGWNYLQAVAVIVIIFLAISESGCLSMPWNNSCCNWLWN